MSRPAKKRTYVRKVEGAKAPSSLPPFTGVDLQHLASAVEMIIRSRSPTQPVVVDSLTNRAEKQVASNGPEAVFVPSKSRLEELYHSLCELLGMQRGFQQYLNPDKESDTSALQQCPASYDEMIGALETALQHNIQTFNEIRSHF